MLSRFFSNFVQILRQHLIHSTYLKTILYRLYWKLPESFKSQDSIRASLLNLSKNKNIFFVNIGSNDGISGDPLSEFIFTKGWKGLLIEPVPHVFNRLKKIYKNVPGILFENVAISDINGYKKFWFIKKNKILKSGYDQIGSFDLNKKKVLSKLTPIWPELKQFLTNKKLPTFTLEKILDKNNIRHVDVLLIDTEGYDYKIVKQINFKKIKPKLIIFEHTNLSKADKEFSIKLLTQNGYHIKAAEDGINSIATLC